MEPDTFTVAYLLENVHNVAFFERYNAKIKEFVNKPEILDEILNLLNDGKKYSLLKLIEQIHLQIDNQIYLNYLKHEINYNYNFYELIFILFVKDLIDKKCLDQFRNKFSLYFCKTDFDESINLSIFLAERQDKFANNIDDEDIEHKKNLSVEENIRKFYSSIRNIEGRVLNHQLECDRYSMKKENIQKSKITDRRQEEMQFTKACGDLEYFDLE